MTVFQKAVTGFNNNVPRKGRSYHIQTEDSGINHPHIMTHLFLGGNIIASLKTSYADILDNPNLTERVKAMMEEQHKAMMRNLLSGKYDSQAAQSIQLHAPKVDKLTPYQEPLASAASILDESPSDASAAVLSSDVKESQIQDVAVIVTPAAKSEQPVSEPEFLNLTPAPPMTAEEHLRVALTSYLEYARTVLESAFRIDV